MHKVHKKFRSRALTREGYRRGGVAHSKEWKTWEADTFTPEQFEAIRNDRKLHVEIVEDEEPAKHAPASKRAIEKDKE